MGRITSTMKRRYEEDGYLVIHDIIAPDVLRRLQAVTSAFVEQSRQLTADADGLELGPGHTIDDPRLRRINDPPARDPAYAAAIRDPDVIDIVTGLLGPDVRHHHSKLTLKLAGHGESVEWHQDWAFYPHTNDSVLEVGVYLDDVDDDNGPLMVVPGSHRGVIFDHHVDGRFGGAVAATDLRETLEQAVAMTGPAGSLTVHHVRMLHGAGPNRSSRPRRLLFQGYSAADAWPLAAFTGVPADYYAGAVVAGTATPVARMEALPVRLPHPLPPTTSLYEIQERHPDRVYPPAP